MLRFYREFTASAGDQLTCIAGVGHAPDGSGAKVAIIGAAYFGAMADGERVLRPIKEIGSPLFDMIQPTTYCDLNSIFDIAYPKGKLYYWKSNFLATLDDSVIDTMVQRLSVVLQNIAAYSWSTGTGQRLVCRRIAQLFTIVTKAIICWCFRNGMVLRRRERTWRGLARRLARWSPPFQSPGTLIIWIRMTPLTWQDPSGRTMQGWRRSRPNGTPKTFSI